MKEIIKAAINTHLNESRGETAITAKHLLDELESELMKHLNHFDDSLVKKRLDAVLNAPIDWENGVTKRVGEKKDLLVKAAQERLTTKKITKAGTERENLIKYLRKGVEEFGKKGQTLAERYFQLVWAGIVAKYKYNKYDLYEEVKKVYDEFARKGYEECFIKLYDANSPIRYIIDNGMSEDRPDIVKRAFRVLDNSKRTKKR